MNKNAHRPSRKFIAIVLIITVAFLSGLLALFMYYKTNVDSALDETLFNLERGSSITEYYFNSSTRYEQYTPELYESCKTGEKKKIWYSLQEITPYLKDGFIAVEDKNFYNHSGVDFKRTSAALLNTVFHFDSTFGASTITQQVIKNISGDNEITFKRKFNEILRAIRLESIHSKDEILEVYMNIVPMGENMVGVGTASLEYFGKQPSELNIPEVATLIGIINAPTKYNPHDNPGECTKKRNDVLYVMYTDGIINQIEYEEALNTELRVLPKASIDEQINSWFIEVVNEDVINALMNEKGLSRNFAESLINGGGLKIYTTVKPQVQKKLEEYFVNEKNFPEKIKQGLEFSMAICDSNGGDLVAIVGAVGKKNGNRVMNHATVPHTPGSALKPLALYGPLINQNKINYATVFDDVPVSFSKQDNYYKEYPKNYPAVYDGLTTVNDALRTSKNTVAIRLYNMLGAENIYRFLTKTMGFDTLVRCEYKSNGEILTDVASSPLALGQLSYGVPLRRLTEAYTVFPSEGVLGSSRSFVAVYDNRGNLILDNKKEETRVFRAKAARIMNALLSNVTDSGTAKSVKLKKIVNTAGKTGTSGDDRDRIFVGYTPYYTAGIWCGFTEGAQPIGALKKNHLKIWDEVMTEIHKVELDGIRQDKIKSFSYAGIQKCAYCKDSGKLYSHNCSYDPRGCRMDYGYFEEDNKPTGICDTHVLCYYDELAEGIATECCPSEYVKLISLLRINDRSFKKEIIISDADYVYMDMDEYSKMGDNYDVPYFINMIPDGEYVGRGKNKKQFNSGCYIHRD